MVLYIPSQNRSKLRFEMIGNNYSWNFSRLKNNEKEKKVNSHLNQKMLQIYGQCLRPYKNICRNIWDKVFKSELSKFFKGYLPQNLLSPFLNTLFHMQCFEKINICSENIYNENICSENICIENVCRNFLEFIPQYDTVF